MGKVWERWSEPATIIVCFALAAAIISVIVYEPAHSVLFWTGGRPMLEVLGWIAALAVLTGFVAAAAWRRLHPGSKRRITLARTVLWLELFALPLGLIGLGATFTELSEARQVAREEREERYREIIFGNDKEYGESWRALGRLMDMGIAVPTPDTLACKAKTERCYVEGLRAHPPEILGVDRFDGSNIHFGWDLENIIFHHATFSDAQFGGLLRNVAFNQGVFRGAQISTEIISSVDFAEMSNVRFWRVHMGGADLSDARNLREVTFDFSNMSGAILCGPPIEHIVSWHPEFDPVSTSCPSLSKDTFALAYYQRHSPPLGMEWFLDPILMWRCDTDNEFVPTSEADFVRAGCTRKSLLEQPVWSRWPDVPEEDN